MSSTKEVKLGSQCCKVPALGLGCMDMITGFEGDICGKADEKEARIPIHQLKKLSRQWANQ